MLGIPQVGTLLSHRYRLDSVLGRGGMGQVFAGFDEVLGRAVAVKFVMQYGHLSQTQRDGFMREAKALARLSHPNIAVAYDYGIHDDVPFLVMEHVEGQSLSGLAKNSAIPMTWCAEYGRQVASALAYAHSRGTIHRDVKPQNIVVGSDLRARLVDFGVAHEIGTTGEFTEVGAVKGTPDYMSPECKLGGPPTVASDIYSLGRTLAVILSTDSPIPSFRPSTPVELRALVSDMMAFDPVDRPQDCGEVEQRLNMIVLKLRGSQDDKTPQAPSGSPDPLKSLRFGTRLDTAAAHSSLGAEHQELFVVAGGRIQHRWWWHGQGWSDWATMPALPDRSAAATITAGYHTDDYQDLFVISTTGRLFHTWFDGPTGTWTPWDDMGPTPLT